MAEHESTPSLRRFALPMAVLLVAVLAVAGIVAVRRPSSQGVVEEYEPPLPRPRQNAPFVKSPDVVVDTMVEVAELTRKDHVYDLGCGDGRIVITAALKSGCRGTGFDIDRDRVAEARKNVEAHGVEGLVAIEQQDIFEIDLSRTDIVMMYLLPRLVNDLIPQFEKMPPGSRIVSHDFWLEQIRPELVVEVPGEETGASPHLVFLYRTPLHVDPSLPRGKSPRPEDAKRRRGGTDH